MGIVDTLTSRVHVFYKKLNSWLILKSFLSSFQFLITKLTLSFDSRILLGGYNRSKSQKVQADQSNKLKYFPNISYKLRSCSKSTFSFLTN